MRLSITTSLCILLITFSSLLSTASEACEKGESCQLAGNVLGVVKVDTDCDYFVRLRAKRKRTQGSCGFEGLRGLVCCPLEPATRFGSPNVPQQAPLAPPIKLRKAVQACKQFGVKPISGDYRIINGNFSEIGEFPHFAQLAYRNIENNEISFDCGGVLISHRFVLTAAHCCKLSRRPEFVRLGKVCIEIPRILFSDQIIAQILDYLFRAFVELLR